MFIQPPEIPEGYWHILEEAAEVAKQRGSQYGDYRVNFDRIVKQCKVLGLETSRQDLYKMMIATKLARQENKHDKDNLLDMINYTAMLLADGDDDRSTNDERDDL